MKMDKVIKEFEIYIKNFHPSCTSDGVELDLLKEVLNRLKEKPQFIPLTDGKPPYDKDVLLYLKSGEYFVGHRENHWGQDVYCDDKLGSGYVHPTHWMKLPKKPKDGE